MLDIYSVVNLIRRFLSGGESPATPSLSELACEYAAAADDAARRYLVCDSLLRRGFRSAAVQEIESAPPLMEVIAALNFPEREEWRDVAMTMHLEPPSTSLPNAAPPEWRQACDRERAVRELMRRHRLLALARSALWMRIDALRDLAQAEPDNPIWQEDLHVLEDLDRQNRGALTATGALLVSTDEASAATRSNVIVTARLPTRVSSGGWHSMLVVITQRTSPSAATTGLAAPDAGENLVNEPAGVPLVAFEDAEAVLLNRGTTVTLVPQCDGVVFNPPRYAFQWMEDAHRVEFRLSTLAAPAGSNAAGTLTVFVGLRRVRDIAIQIAVDDRSGGKER